jgi:AraC-like DNA-binding protein
VCRVHRHAALASTVALLGQAILAFERRPVDLGRTDDMPHGQRIARQRETGDTGAMSIAFRAVDEPAATREDYWRHVLTDTIAPMDVRFDDHLNTNDQIVTGELGAVHVIDSGTGPGEGRRTSTHIRRSDPERYQLFVQIEGTSMGEQESRWAHLGPGDLSLTDLSRPFRCIYQARRAVLVTFPHAMLPLPRQDVASLLGRRIPGDQGPAALLSTFVRQLPGHLDDDDGAGGTRLATAVLDLMAVAVATQLDSRSAVPTDARQRALLRRIHASIDARLGDFDLTPATIAAAHHISVRYLHQLFEPEKHSVADLIRTRRLEKCRRDLLDPTLADRPVAAIGARWGFPNAAHFSRLFRDAYGLPPSQFRRQFGQPRTPDFNR